MAHNSCTSSFDRTGCTPWSLSSRGTCKLSEFKMLVHEEEFHVRIDRAQALDQVRMDKSRCQVRRPERGPSCTRADKLATTLSIWTKGLRWVPAAADGDAPLVMCLEHEPVDDRIRSACYGRAVHVSRAQNGPCLLSIRRFMWASPRGLAVPICRARPGPFIHHCRSLPGAIHGRAPGTPRVPLAPSRWHTPPRRYPVVPPARTDDGLHRRMV